MSAAGGWGSGALEADLAERLLADAVGAFACADVGILRAIAACGIGAPDFAVVVVGRVGCAIAGVKRFFARAEVTDSIITEAFGAF